MTPEIIQMVLQFMQRVTLQGAEVDAYVTCIQTLQQALREPVAEEPKDGPYSTGA